jgi:hypothetical protein
MSPKSPRDESLVDRLIREAHEAGEFDGLPGAGQPIEDLDATYDPEWWVKAWVRRELRRPEIRALQEAVSEELAALAECLDELEVRGRLEALNRRISAIRDPNARREIHPIDVNAALERWRRTGRAQ